MNVIYTAILGIVQGLAEFLPISSSGHLEVVQRLLGMQMDSQGMLLLTVLLHAGTLGFIHPSSGDYMEFHSPLPEVFEAVLEKLRR